LQINKPNTAEVSKNYQAAKFLLSVGNLRGLPPDNGREVAFAGRSNAGKSSAINALTQQNRLARTSKTPGRTQLLNFFSLDADRRLVDLPGYGYAKVSENVKQQWHRLLDGYLSSRRCLQALVILMDIRHPLKDIDLTLLTWCKEANLPALVVLTKSDKLKSGAVKATRLQVVNNVNKLFGDADITVITFSSLKKQGLDELRRALDSWLDLAST